MNFIKERNQFMTPEAKVRRKSTLMYDVPNLEARDKLVPKVV